MTDQQQRNLIREAALAGYNRDSFNDYVALAKEFLEKGNVKRAVINAECALRAVDRFPFLYPKVTEDQIAEAQLLSEMKY